jgi:ribosomal protein S18 acetylase RimI-like enzyme
LLTIRAATTQDRNEAGIVRSSVLPSTHPYQYELNIGAPNCANFVAVENGEVVGFLSLLLTRWNAQGQHLWERLAPYLAFIGVLPNKQHRGIGRSLLRCAAEHVARSCPKEPFLFLEHRPENEAARLYVRAGFRAMTAEEVFDVAGMNPKGAVMCLELACLRTTN